MHRTHPMHSLPRDCFGCITQGAGLKCGDCSKVACAKCNFEGKPDDMMQPCDRCVNFYCGNCRPTVSCSQCHQAACSTCLVSDVEALRGLCFVCNKIFCSNCRTMVYCDSCMQSACSQCLGAQPSHMGFCNVCEKVKCDRCDPGSSYCAYCDIGMCSACAVACERCQDTVCKNCAQEQTQPCIVCKAVYCSECQLSGDIKACKRCSEAACSKCHAHFFGAPAAAAVAAETAGNSGSGSSSAGTESASGVPAPPRQSSSSAAASIISGAASALHSLLPQLVPREATLSKIIRGIISSTGGQQQMEVEEPGGEGTAAAAGTHHTTGGAPLLCVHCALIRAAVRAARHAGWRWCRACRWRLCGGSQLTAENCCRRGACVPHAYSRIEPTSSMMAPAT